MHNYNISTKEIPKIKPLRIDFNEIKNLFESLKEILEENKIIMEQDCKVSQVINTENTNIFFFFFSILIEIEFEIDSVTVVF